ncbi:MAG TPA: thiamine pyrophosphate-dependent dehydrogenase E1 component subunit alpha [Solirubrobacterales bacterium]|nr:thiamine pyrophosphate-dependent dehydrogenase E1 component subunit alpha [Solirubrobacterales bacterium]
MSPLPSEEPLRRVIGDGESLPDGELADFGEHELEALHRDMILLRVFDERAVLYQRQGRIGTYAIYWGHEAIQAGAHFALDPTRDWVFPSYRESALGLLRGVDPATVLAWWRGHPSGWWNPLEHRLGGVSVPIGSHVSHASGAAWGMQARGEDGCAVAFFGDGATSEGSFHEGVNFGAVMEAPVVFVCNNNGWAISTPIASQSRAASLADKAVGYGIPGVRIDGRDALAVYDAVREAVSRARDGGGPTFVEAVHYRVEPHGTADDTALYRDGEEAEAARRDDCVGRLESYMRRRGLLDDDRVLEIREEATATIKAAMREVERLPDPDPALVFDTTYELPPPSLVRQRDEALGRIVEVR